MRRLNGIAFGLLLEATLLTHGITLPTVIDGPPSLLVPRVDLTELWFVERRAPCSPCTVGLQRTSRDSYFSSAFSTPCAKRPRARVSGLGAVETSRARRSVGTRAPHIIFRAPHRKLWAHWQARYASIIRSALPRGGQDQCCDTRSTARRSPPSGARPPILLLVVPGTLGRQGGAATRVAQWRPGIVLDDGSISGERPLLYR